MRTNRSTKNRYAGLKDNPQSLFPGVNTRLVFPDGTWPGTIIFDDGFGKVVVLEVSLGPAGLGFRLKQAVGSPPLTLTSALIHGSVEQQREAHAHVSRGLEAFEIGAVVFNNDEWSQRFRRWTLDPDKHTHPGPKPDTFYVGVGNDPKHPGIISGPFYRKPALLAGHTLYVRAEGGLVPYVEKDGGA